jgi:hypothetical protein
VIAPKVHRVNWPKHCGQRIVFERCYVDRRSQASQGNVGYHEVEFSCPVCRKTGAVSDFA